MKQQLRIFSSWTPQQCVDALEFSLENQQPVQVESGISLLKQVVGGRISESKIRLHVGDRVSNSSSTQFTGRLIPMEGGSIFEGRFHLSLFTRIFLIVFRTVLILFGLACCALVIASFQPGEPIPSGLMMLPLIVLAALYYLSHVIVRLQPQRLEFFIKTSLQAGNPVEL